MTTTGTIKRSPGTIVTAAGIAYLAGSGYHGATDELDCFVDAAAERVSAIFGGADVEIRFNSDRRSGGAWLRLGDGFTTCVKIGAGLCFDYDAGDEPIPGTERIRPTVYVTKWAVLDPSAHRFERVSGHASNYDVFPVDDLDAAEAWIRSNVILDVDELTRRHRAATEGAPR